MGGYPVEGSLAFHGLLSFKNWSFYHVGRYYEAGASFDIYLRSHRNFLSDTKSRFTMLLINDTLTN